MPAGKHGPKKIILNMKDKLLVTCPINLLEQPAQLSNNCFGYALELRNSSKHKVMLTVCEEFGLSKGSLSLLDRIFCHGPDLL